MYLSIKPYYIATSIDKWQFGKKQKINVGFTLTEQLLKKKIMENLFNTMEKLNQTQEI